MQTRTIIYPRIEVNEVTDFHAIPKSVCIRTQAKKIISSQPICLTCSNYYCILEYICRRDRVDFERDVEFYSDDEVN